MKKKWLWPIYLILFALLVAVGYWFGIGPDKKAARIASMGEFVGREWGRKDWGAMLLVKAAEINPNTTAAMNYLINAVDLRKQIGETESAQRMVWQILAKYCASPPRGTAPFEDDGEIYCQTALRLAIRYEQTQLGKTVKMGSKEEAAALEKIYRSDRPDDIRALARYMMILNDLDIATTQYRHSPAFKRLQQTPQLLSIQKEYARQWIDLADEFPKSYWASRALFSAAIHYANGGEEQLARQEKARLLKEFPDTPAAKEALKIKRW